MSKSLGNAYLLDELQDTTAPFDESNTTETEGSNLGIFAGIMAPLAILIGFATASVGFTCWSIVVPLLWVGFGIDVFDSLFTSVATDWINSSILTALYAWQGRVVFKEGSIFGGLSAVCAIGCMFGARWVIDHYKEYLKRGLGYVIIVISFTFILRGYKQYKQQKEALEKQQEGEELTELSMTKEEQGERELLLKDKPREPNTNLQWALMAVVSGVSGALSGLVGIGSGLNYVMGYLYLMGFPLLEATSTGCYNMAVTMLAVTMGYLGVIDLNLDTLWPYLLITICFGIVGTLIGAVMSYKISPMILNFIIAGILVVVGVGAVVEPHFIAWVNGE